MFGQITALLWQKSNIPSIEILYVTGRNFLSHKELPVTRRTFLLQEETFCDRKKLPLTERNFLSQEEVSFHNKLPPITGRYFLSHEETSCHTEKDLKIDN
jgi:hypothetical protein